MAGGGYRKIASEGRIEVEAEADNISLVLVIVAGLRVTFATQRDSERQ